MPVHHRAAAASAQRRVAVVFAGTLLLAACKTLSPDGGMDAVADVAGGALHKDVVAIRTPEQAAAVQARIEQLLRRPLTADAAVQIALLNNRGLQAAYNELGIAETVAVAASLPPNPTASLQRISGSVETEIETRIVLDILALATLPARAEIAEARFHAAQLRVALATLSVAAATRRAYYQAIAARSLADFLQQAEATAKNANDLSGRLAESGGMNKLDQTRQQVFYAETRAQSEKGKQQAASARETLTRALGLSGKELAFRLPASLPALPARARRLPRIEEETLARRVDLEIARIELDALAKSYGLTKATRFINLLNASAVGRTTAEKSTGQRIEDRGFEAELQIPLFDFGEVRVREAEETYNAQVNRLVEMSVNARSQAREAYQRYRSAFDIAARYRNEVLPMQQIISDETLLRYNAMMVDVFGLLTDARQRMASTVTGIEAERDFWLASIDLDAVMIAGAANASPGDATADLTPSAGGENN